MPAWIAGIQVRMDASGDVRVDLDSSNPCWNDGIDGVCLTAANVFNDVFKGAHEGHEEFESSLYFNFLLRALRDLRGEILF